MQNVELAREGARVLSVCNACRYCEQYCPAFQAMEQRNVVEAVSIVRAHIRKGKQNVLSDLAQRLAIRELRATATVEETAYQTQRKEEKWPQI